jgi:hypothetical protein
MPVGSYDIEAYGLTAPPFYALALSAIPDGPWDLDALLPYILPYRGASLAVVPGTAYVAGDPFLGYSVMATFVHPDSVGPISGAGVVLIWQSDPPVLSSAPIAVEPWTTPGPGYAVDVPLYRTLLAADVEG